MKRDSRSFPRKVLFVGHALKFEWKTRLRNDHAKDYNAIRNAAIDAAELMALTIHFHNQDNIMQPNGKIFVRFLKNSFAKGEPYSQGEIASFTPNIAADLVACNAARYFTPPIAQEIETATLATDEAETATIETAKPRKARNK